MMKLFKRDHGRTAIVNSCSIALIGLLALAGCSAPAAPAAPGQPQQPADASPNLVVVTPAIDVQFEEGSAKTVTQTITFRNDGVGVMIWAANKSVPWMWMNDNNGALEKGYTKNIEVSIAPSGMQAGTYKGSIFIEGVGARNSPQNVQVTMLIKPKPAVPTSPGGEVAGKPVPPPPWDYDEYFNNVYNLRLRYPKEYVQKTLSDSAFGAVLQAGQKQVDSIRLTITSAYGVEYDDVAFEWAKSIRLTGGGRSPQLVSSENITLMDGVTPGFELLYDSKSAIGVSSQVYIFGIKKGSRYIMFGAVAELATARDRLKTWKETARTMEFVDKD